ncbi:ubiquinol-cytochrome c reductase complex assembly factor 1 [Austrofundulus limnaeus]|uniref:Ubiquinol-cytochrome c reductase complex assembly factor 1 n=1 Tax=Austrofundulus limnaeus TaxID=52670 RepID=A0A2I4BSL4_AUSLI|nr:PREDICTED: ubiquinol-cytochrome-c reductase complex assembly factor 1 [Austrofundulus limnaeus]
MYRWPLQVAARSVARAAGSRTARAKVLDQEPFLGASAPLQRPGTSCLTQSRTLYTNTQLLSVKETPQQAQEEVGAFTRLFEAMGFPSPLKYNKWKMKIAALRMYTCCVERINYDEFFERCSLADTLNSWFLVTQLHVWMCLVRMRQEGREGRFLCHYIVHAMWGDVEQRSKIMGIDAFHRKETMKTMTENFYAAMLGYDEGILSDDRVLAAALWRNLFCCQCEEPQQLELLVEYVRKQMQFIDSLNGEDLLLTGEVQWRPLVEENAQSILKVVRPTYNDAGL